MPCSVTLICGRNACSGGNSFDAFNRPGKSRVKQGEKGQDKIKEFFHIDNLSVWGRFVLVKQEFNINVFGIISDLGPSEKQERALLALNQFQTAFDK